MDETFELRDKLNELSNRVEDYKTCHKDILTTKQEYISLRKKKPKKKPEKKLKKPFSSTPIRIALLIILLLWVAFCATWCFTAFILYLIGAIFSALGVAVVGIIATVLIVISLIICSFGAWGVATTVFFLMGEIAYSVLSKYFYKRAYRKYKENKRYNRDVYPTLYQEYCEKEALLSSEYDLLVHRAELKIDTDEQFFGENKGVIAKKYYLDLDRIIEALDSQRAYGLNDAINLVIRDKRLENSGKHKKHERVQAEGLYPEDIMLRARVFSSNCNRCPKKDSCIKLWCRMNDYFRRLDEQELDKIIFEETGEIQLTPELKQEKIQELEAPKMEKSDTEVPEN
jgi:predicted membrane protein